MIDIMPWHLPLETAQPLTQAAPLGASSGPMGVLFIVAMVLLAIALVLAVLGRWIRYRNRPRASDERYI